MPFPVRAGVSALCCFTTAHRGELCFPAAGKPSGSPENAQLSAGAVTHTESAACQGSIIWFTSLL